LTFPAQAGTHSGELNQPDPICIFNPDRPARGNDEPRPEPVLGPAEGRTRGPG